MNLDLVDIVADGVEHRLDGSRAELGALAVGEDQLGAVEVEPGRTALVHLDMRLAVAQHAAVRGDHGRQREAVGSGAGGDPQC